MPELLGVSRGPVGVGEKEGVVEKLCDCTAVKRDSFPFATFYNNRLDSIYITITIARTESFRNLKHSLWRPFLFSMIQL